MTTDDQLQPMDPDPARADHANSDTTGDADAAATAATLDAGAAQPPLPPPPPAGSPTLPSSAIAEWPSPPAEPPGGIPEPGSTVGLWPAGASAAVSFLAGFPAGMALVAGAWYRLGRKGIAIANLAAGVALMMLLVLLPDQLGVLGGLTNIMVAVYVYAVLGRARGNAARLGIVVGPGGVPSGLAIIIGGWAVTLLCAFVLGVVLALANWEEELAGGANGATDNPVAVARTASPAATAGGSGPEPTGPESTGSGSTGAASGTFELPDLDACPTVLEDMHQAPDVEALLPRRVDGRDLSIWSVSGWCWLHVAADDDGTAQIAPMIRDEGIDVTNLRYAVAGRADVDNDPPYFVFAASRPQDPDEHDLARTLLLGGAGYDDWPVDLSKFEPREVGDRMAFVGTPDMVTQSEHQRGRPWLYQTDSTMFLIVTDDDAWAEDAIGQLPCCWSNE